MGNIVPYLVATMSYLTLGQILQQYDLTAAQLADALYATHIPVKSLYSAADVAQLIRYFSPQHSYHCYR